MTTLIQERMGSRISTPHHVIRPPRTTTCLPSIPEGEAEPAEKVRCTSGGAEWQEEEEERLPGIPEQDAEPAEKVRCTSATCASLVAGVVRVPLRVEGSGWGGGRVCS